MSNKTQEQNKDGLALVVGGLFILALAFATYNYFNKGEAGKPFLGGSGGDTPTAQGEGDVNGNGASTENADGTDESGSGSANGATGTGGSSDYSTVRAWVANDYVEGDVTGDTHAVIWGDTLWEISEGAYGDGANWMTILDANKENVGYLPNGQQALIVEGQVLNIPR